MSYLAQVSYTGDGSTTQYSITFPFLDSTHVKAFVDGVSNTAFTISSSTLTFNSAPANSAVIRIERQTPTNSRLVDFTDGSVLTESDLDKSADQNFFIAQEISDANQSAMTIDTDDKFDAQNKVIKNVANPVNNNDAVNKTYLENTWLSTSDKANLTTVAGQSSKIALLGTADAIADMNTLATADVVADMNTLATADVVADMNTLGTADVVADMNTLATSSNVTNMNTLAGISGLSTLASNNANVTALAGKVTELGLLGTSDVITDLGLLGTSDVVADMALLANADVIADMNTLATSDIISDLNTLASSDIVNDLNTLANADVVSDMNTLATSANVTAMGHLGTSANVTNMATLGTSTNVSNMATLAGITNLTNLADAHSAVSTVATNIAGVNSFAERYRVQAGVPASSNDVGDLVFDTTAGKLKVFDGSSYALAGSSVNGTNSRHRFTATAGQTTFTGADLDGNTLSYDVAGGVAFIDVYLNGVHLDSSDYTATSGSSVVLSSGATVGDEIYITAFGTFTLASFSAGNITSGTINNDRLPSPVLTVKGDGSSTDGAIQLNCSQNSHGVKIKSPAHSAGQSYTLILPTSVGTANQVLATNGNSTNQLSWIDATETKPTVADVSQTIPPATATTINITGTNFVSIPIVEFIKTDGSVTLANTVAFTNATTLSVNVTLASGNYYVRIENPDGNAGRSTQNIITASTAPTFSTNAGSLGTFAGDFSGNLATIAGTSDSAVTFSEVGSNLSSANVTLASNGVLSTTDFGGSSTTATLYNFTIRITDAEGQTADRDFSLQSSFGATGGGQFN